VLGKYATLKRIEQEERNTVYSVYRRRKYDPATKIFTRFFASRVEADRYVANEDHDDYYWEIEAQEID
jgi:hypothetical protein